MNGRCFQPPRLGSFVNAAVGSGATTFYRVVYAACPCAVSGLWVGSKARQGPQREPGCQPRGELGPELLSSARSWALRLAQRGMLGGARWPRSPHSQTNLILASANLGSLSQFLHFSLFSFLKAKKGLVAYAWSSF